MLEALHNTGTLPTQANLHDMFFDDQNGKSVFKLLPNYQLGCRVFLDPEENDAFIYSNNNRHHLLCAGEDDCVLHLGISHHAGNCMYAYLVSPTDLGNSFASEIAPDTVCGGLITFSHHAGIVGKIQGLILSNPTPYTQTVQTTKDLVSTPPSHI